MHFTIIIKMLLTSSIYLQLTVLTTALRDVHVEIPLAVRRGEKAILKCFYDLEGDSLYSVKWYKGRREFYSYTPKEEPAMKVFQFAGVKVERSLSNESQLVLESVNAATSGKYSCEVSADAPSFHTLISAGDLEVVVPGKDPVITGIKSRYHVGDIIRGNCTSAHSRPAANITWTINGYEVNPSYVRQHKPTKDLRELETVISSIHFVVTPQHFIRSKLKIRCAAYIHDVYWKSSEKSIEEDRHLIHNNEVNFINNFSQDYFDMDVNDNRDNDLIERSDTYLTHIKGDMSSLNSNSNNAAQWNPYNCLWLQLMATLVSLFYQQSNIKWPKLLQQLLLLFNCSLNRNLNTNENEACNTNNTIGMKITLPNVLTLLHLAFFSRISHLNGRTDERNLKKSKNGVACKQMANGQIIIQTITTSITITVINIKPIKYNNRHRKYALTVIQRQMQLQQQQQQPQIVHNLCSRHETVSKLCYSLSLSSSSSSSSSSLSSSLLPTASTITIIAKTIEKRKTNVTVT